VITVTGHATPISEAAASVVVMKADQIQGRAPDALSAGLRSLPFLYLTQSGGLGGLTTITIRGGKPNFTQVMFDGIPLNDMTNALGGSYDFANSMTTGVEQVEIVRGPMSALYGSDAVAGVINLVPRRGGGKPTLSVQVGGGNFGFKQGEVSASAALRKFDFAASGSVIDVGEQVLNDEFRLGTLSLHPRLLFSENKVLSFTARYQNSNSAGFPINSGGPELAIVRDPQSIQNREWIGGARWRHQAGPAWLYGLDLDVYSRDQNSDIPAIFDRNPPSFRSVPSQESRSSFERLRVSGTGTHSFSPHWSTDLGAGWRRETGHSNSLLASSIADVFRPQRNRGSGYATVTYQAGRLAASASGRIDSGAGFRNVYTPRASIAYLLKPGWPRLKASWGRGFKLPSFYALANKLIGNPELTPRTHQI